MQRITHLMPVRDGEKYIQRALQMITQNFQVGDEIIVVDDGSTDGTVKILSEFEKEFNSLRILSIKNRGLVNALNLGFLESSSNWVARYDVDDNYMATRIIEQRKLISEDVAVIFADYSMQLSNGLKMGFFPSPISNVGTKLSLLHSQQTAHSVSLINRNHFNEAGGYRIEDFPAEDLGLWLRISKFGALVSVPIELLIYQLSNGSTLGTRQRQARMMKSKLISSIGIQLPPAFELERDLDLTIDSYLHSSHFSLRSYLLLQNIKRGTELGLIPLKLNQSFQSRLWPNLLDKKSELAIALTYKIARSIYRKLL